MITKSKQFDKQLAQDLVAITINRNQPYRLKGSYSRKKDGALVSDIDYTAVVRFNRGLLDRIVQILERQKKFVFVQFGCGKYKEFRVPWTIDDAGNCDYSEQVGEAWLNRLQKLLPDTIYSRVAELLVEPTVKDLIEVGSVIFPFAEIKWDIDSIRRGYIAARGEKYDLISLMKTETAVLEFAYLYDGNVCGIDIGMDDKQFQKGLPDVMHKYYTGDYYSIFKSYQKRLKPEMLGQYKEIQKRIEGLVAVRYEVEMMMALDGRLGDARLALESLRTSVHNRLLKLGITNVTDAEAMIALTALIEDEILPFIPMYQEVLQPQHVRKIAYNLHRGAAGMRSCSFLTSPVDFSTLSWLAVRTMLPVDKVEECYLEVSAKTGKTVRELISETIVDNAFSIRGDSGSGVLTLYDGENVVNEYPETVLDQLQSYVFIGVSGEIGKRVEI